MRKKVFGICDTDKSFIGAFTSYINRRENGRFTVRAFSAPEYLLDYLQGGSFDLLLVSESFIDAAEECMHEVSLPEKATFILAEQKDAADFAFPAVYKYQSAERILSRVLEAGERAHSGRTGAGRVRITGVYSPIGRCGKTSLAMALSRELAGRGGSILISFDEFPCCGELTAEGDALSLSDLIYRLSADAAPAADGLALPEGDCVIVPCVIHPEDIRRMDPAVAVKLTEAAASSGNWRNVVLDVGCAVADPRSLLRSCREIYMPVPGDEASRIKLERWERLMEDEDRDILDKIRKTGLWPEGQAENAAARLLGMK